MKKIIAIILAAGLILGFIKYREDNRPKETENNEIQVENEIDQEPSQDLSTKKDLSTESENSPKESIDTSSVDSLKETGIEYVKNNDYQQLSEDEKSEIYSLVKGAISQMGYNPDDLSYQELENIYNDCQTYMIENNVDADNLSLIDQAKLYNILQSHMKNK